MAARTFADRPTGRAECRRDTQQRTLPETSSGSPSREKCHAPAGRTKSHYTHRSHAGPDDDPWCPCNVPGTGKEDRWFVGTAERLLNERIVGIFCLRGQFVKGRTPQAILKERNVPGLNYHRLPRILYPVPNPSVFLPDEHTWSPSPTTASRSAR